MRPALARLKQSSRTSSSIRLWLTGGQVGWTTKMSAPRTSSSMRTDVSPSGNSPSVMRPRVSPRQWTIFSARGRLARPLKTRSLFIRFIVFELHVLAGDVPDYVEAVHRWDDEMCNIYPYPRVFPFVFSLRRDE